MPEVRQRPTSADIEFMRSLEDNFKAQTALKNRSQFKIFYGPIWRATIVLLGINPAGDPKTIAPDGVFYLDGRNDRASSSTGYYENGENDLVDCTWPENTGLLKLLIPILGSPDAIRTNVVKTNLAFIRRGSTKNRGIIEHSKYQSAHFLRLILERVLPDMILLTGVRLYDFRNRYCTEVVELSERQEERSVNQTIIFPARVRLQSGHVCIAVELAHASRFSWIYSKHEVGQKIKALLNECPRTTPAIGKNSQLESRENSKVKECADASRKATIVSEVDNSALNGELPMDTHRTVGPEQTKEILRKLEVFGLDNDIYQTYLHHAQHSISRMYGYTAHQYIVGSRNELLHEKLEWMLRACVSRNIQRGDTEAVRKLAKETKEAGWRPDAAN